MKKDIGESYSKLPNLVLGFHGCDKNTFKNVIIKGQHLKNSNNNYDWLGHGIYFWENSYVRALDWAKNRYGKDAKVLGAVVDLGNCLNLTDYSSTEILKNAYKLLKYNYEMAGIPIPENVYGKSNTDLLLRYLDCSVIEYVHYLKKLNNPNNQYDSVRGVFTEGKEVYEGSGFVEKTHIQLCIVNPNCIKGYFEPLKFNKKYGLP